MDFITIFLLAFSVLLLILLSWVWPPDSPWSPWWRTDTKKSEIAVRISGIASNDNVYELGCGEATFLTTAVKKTGCKGVGIEIDPARYLTAWINIRLKGLVKDITLKKKNFFDENLSEASVIFIYLVPRVLEKLKPKIFKETKKGTKVISYRYRFEKDKRMELIKEDKSNKIFVYKIV